MMAASFEKVIEPYQVALDVRARVGDRVAHTCLSSQIDNYSKLLLSKELIDEGFVGKIALDKLPITTKSVNLIETFILDINIIIICNLVQTYNTHVLELLENTFHKV